MAASYFRCTVVSAFIESSLHAGNNEVLIFARTVIHFSELGVRLCSRNNDSLPLMDSLAMQS